MKKIYILLSILALLAGCQTSPQKSAIETDSTPVSCPLQSNNKLTVCTADYKPVCVKNKQGKWVNISNACNACSNGYTEYLPDACEYQSKLD